MVDTGSGVKVELGLALTVAHRVGRTAVNVVTAGALPCMVDTGPGVKVESRQLGLALTGSLLCGLMVVGVGTAGVLIELLPLVMSFACKRPKLWRTGLEKFL